MKLSISNIAWQKHDDPKILDLLSANQVSGIEIAPTKIWPNWEGASYESAVKYKKMMKDCGFSLPAMQAILFGKPELQLFDSRTHFNFLEHIKLVSDLANGLGSHIVVFGAPKNRIRGQIPYTQAFNMAAEFFYKAAKICKENNCSIGLEHNPVEYGCDFITNALDAKELVKLVDHPGFKLHIDSAAVYMCGGNFINTLEKVGAFSHYHISEPMLEPILGGVVDHKKALDWLSKKNYKNWVSIEMKQPQSIEILEKSLNIIQKML